MRWYNVFFHVRTGNNPRFTRVANTNFSAYSPISYIIKTKKYIFHDAYLEGERFNTSDPSVTIGYAGYTPGEGYSGNKIWVNQSQTRGLSFDGLFSPGPQTRLTFTVTGGSNRELTVNQHHLQVSIGATNLVDTLYSYNVPITFSRYIPTDMLAGGTANVIFSHLGVGGQIMQEWESVSNITAIYPRIMDFTGTDADDFEISANGTPGYSYVRLTGLSLSTGDSVVLIDLNNHNLMRTVYEDGVVKSLVPNLPGNEKCYFIKSNAINIIQKIVAVEPSTARFIPYHSNVGDQDVDYLILTSSQLRPAADQYAQYRDINGFPNTYHTLVIDIDQLYDQYAYGIPKHPLAIRSFLAGLDHNYPGRIKYLFIVGKAFQARDYRNDVTSYKNTLVPTWGYPPSDLLFTLGLSNPDEMAIPVGRLSAYLPDNVIDYLEKVQDFESDQQIPSAALKNAVQFGGGGGFLEQILFKNYLMEYDSLLCSPYFGARTFNLFKQSSGPNEINQSEYLHDLLENKGVSLINYFANAPSGSALL